METFDGNIQINRYDAEGLRHEMEENGKLVQFIFRGTEVVAEETQEEKIRYIRTHELLASDAESARTYYHYASDEMGSITHVTAGNDILNRYEYDAWGNAEVCEEQVANRFRFNAQQYDPVSQQYYLRARFYNPVIARFTQEDTYRGDGLNLYAYCRNNPVYYVDPSGHICDPAAQKIMEKLGSNQAKQNEKRKLGSYLRNKAKHGETLNPAEMDAAKSTKANIEAISRALKHSSEGDFTYDPKTGALSKMKSGGHGQANIDFLEKNGMEYNIVKEYSNGVRIGNVPEHKTKAKAKGTNQSWFPKNWSGADIMNAGEYVANLPENKRVADGITVFGEYKGVRVGVIRTNGQIGTVFPDSTKQP